MYKVYPSFSADLGNYVNQNILHESLDDGINNEYQNNFAEIDSDIFADDEGNDIFNGNII